MATAYATLGATVQLHDGRRGIIVYLWHDRSNLYMMANVEVPGDVVCCPVYSLALC